MEIVYLPVESVVVVLVPSVTVAPTMADPSLALVTVPAIEPGISASAKLATVVLPATTVTLEEKLW